MTTTMMPVMATGSKAMRVRPGRGQRDFFGAHTYQRIDKPGTFHTLWSGDRTEIEAEDTH